MNDTLFLPDTRIIIISAVIRETIEDDEEGEVHTFGYSE